jgi:hypothetical protein
MLLLRGVEQQLGIAERLAACVMDRRDPSRIGFIPICCGT